MAEPFVVEKRIEARPETVFAFFTEPEKYRRWKGVDAELDPRPGGIYRVRMNERTSVRGSYVEVDPPRRLVFTWGWESTVEMPAGIGEVPAGSSTVEITFTPDGAGTLLRLVHSGLPTEVAFNVHGFGWGLYLGRLATALAGGDPGPEPLTASDPYLEFARLAGLNPVTPGR